jgi:hypothetical protein
MSELKPRLNGSREGNRLARSIMLLLSDWTSVMRTLDPTVAEWNGDEGDSRAWNTLLKRFSDMPIRKWSRRRVSML